MTAWNPGLPDADRLGRRDTFSAEAERYDRARPSYPEDLFDRVERFGELHGRAHVLEIAAGTGKATRSLVDRGWKVDAVELGAGMAAVLRNRLGGRIRVVVGAFEEVSLEPAHYDLAFCATAFHWLDPATRVERVARVLRPGGTVAIVWTRHVRGGTQALFGASQAVYARVGMGADGPALPDEHELDLHDEEFRSNTAFAEVETAVFATEREYDTAGYLDLVGTYSETIAAAPEQRGALLDGLRELVEADFDGRVVKRSAFVLVLARRV